MSAWHWTRGHGMANWLQTLWLVGVLLAIGALAGYVLFGEHGLWLSLAAMLFALLLEPVASARLTLALYRARPLAAHEAPWLWDALARLAARAGLPVVPALYRIPDAAINAFAVGSRRRPAIAVTEGMLARLDSRELVAVLAHETAHIAHDDLRVMNLADYVGRLTSLLSALGIALLAVLFPDWLDGDLELPWAGLLVLMLSPYLALLTQLGLSRVREHDADLAAAEYTGDPGALASALIRIELDQHRWRWLIPGGGTQPSWLRTHPATAERVRRLRTLTASVFPRSVRDSRTAPVAVPSHGVVRRYRY